MNMKLCGFTICQKYTGVVIKLDNDDGALNTVVKGVGVAVAPDPAKASFVEPALDVL